MKIPATNKPTLNTTIAATLAHLYPVIQDITGTNRNKTKNQDKGDINCPYLRLSTSLVKAGTNRNKTKNYLQSKLTQPPPTTYVTCTMAIQVNQEAVNNQPIMEISG